MTIPTIDTNFVDNDKYWYDVGAAYTLHVYDILQNAQIDNDRKSNKILFDNYDFAAFGLDSYPIFSEDFRKPINDMIVRHFLEWEIGYETDFLFREHVRGDMARIMPELNIKLKARFEAYNTEKMFETDNSKSVHKSDDWHKFLDTPQGQTDMIDDNYLTNMSQNHVDDETTHTGSSGTAATPMRRVTQARFGILSQRFVTN